MRSSQVEKLSKVKYISVMSDSSTDRSLNENEIIYVRYVNQRGLPKSWFVGLWVLKRANAIRILEIIDHILLTIGLIEWKDKVVGFGADGASVMMGHKGGVVALLKADVPNLIDIHCVAHRLQLSVLDAIRDHPYTKIAS